MCALPILWERPPIGLGRLISSAMADRGGGVFLRTVFQERLIDCRGADLDKRSQRSPLPFLLVPGSAGTRLTRHLLYPAYIRSEEHTSELQSLMRISYAVFCLKNK